MGSIVGYMSLPGATVSADLSAKQYHAVKLSTTAPQVTNISNGNTERPIGILQDDPAVALEPCDVAVFGVCRAEAGGTITTGDSLSVNNDGELITDVEQPTASTIDLYHIATAMQDAADGDIFDVLLHTPILSGAE